MQVPKVDFKDVFGSAVVVVLVIGLLQYFGGIMVDTTGQVDVTGLATIGVMFVTFAVLIALVTANTPLPTPDWVTRPDK